MKTDLAVIWDWNGTIVDDASVFIKIMNEFLAERSLPLINSKKYREFFTFPVKSYYKLLGFQFSKKSFDELSLEFIKRYKEEMFKPSLVGEVKTFLTKLHLRGVPQIVVSAQENKLLSKAVNYYGLESLFVATYGIQNYKAASKVKMAKEVFDKHFKNYKKTIFIGDTEHDAEVATDLNIDCFLVSYGHCTYKRLKQTGFPVFRSVSELENAIQKHL